MAYKNKNEQQNWIYADLLLVRLNIIFADFENVKRKFINECVTEVWGLISLAYPSFSTDCFFGEKSESKTNFNHQGKYI